MNLRIARTRDALVDDVRPLPLASRSPRSKMPERDQAEGDHGRAHRLVRVVAEVVEVHATTRGEEDGADEREAEGMADSPLHAEHPGAERATQPGAVAFRVAIFVVAVRAVMAAAGFHVAAGLALRRVRRGDDGERDEVIGSHEHVQRA